MGVRNAGENAGKRWAEGHPGEAVEVENVVIGDFALRDCHKTKPQDDMICPACFNDFLTAMHGLDNPLAQVMKTNGYGWVVGWIKGALP